MARKSVWVLLIEWVLRWVGLGPAGRSARRGLPREAKREASAKTRAKRDAARTVAGVRVEYAPRPDGAPDPGEVVWGWIAYEDDPSRGKDRPVLLIGRRGRALVGVSLTSKRHERARQVSVGAGPWDREGRESFARVERLHELDEGAIRREGAVLPRARFEAVIDALEALHGR